MAASAKAEPNVVPLCDVLLVLLIIFMVITPLVQRGVDVRLPETASDQSTQANPSGLIVLTLLKDGTVRINQQPIEYGLLQESLRQTYSTRQDKTIFIRANAKVPYSQVVSLIDLAKGAGVETIALIPEYFEED
jgi:biopolymer transport protein ExbD